MAGQSIYLNEKYLEKVDKEIESEGFDGRSNFINTCIDYYFIYKRYKPLRKNYSEVMHGINFVLITIILFKEFFV